MLPSLLDSRLVSKLKLSQEPETKDTADRKEPGPEDVPHTDGDPAASGTLQLLGAPVAEGAAVMQSLDTGRARRPARGSRRHYEGAENRGEEFKYVLEVTHNRAVMRKITEVT